MSFSLSLQGSSDSEATHSKEAFSYGRSISSSSSPSTSLVNSSSKEIQVIKVVEPEEVQILGSDKPVQNVKVD